MVKRRTLLAAPALLCSGSTVVFAADGEMLAHNVYFSLKDASDSAKANLVAACHKYLKDHEGVVFFAAGSRAVDFKREANDLGFDVALNIVFKGKADHDRYQVHEKHKQFIQENVANWSQVRVFDSYVK